MVDDDRLNRRILGGILETPAAKAWVARAIVFVCGLPLGAPDALVPSAMVNLLGDVWRPEPRWGELLGHPGVQLHLYGKAEARPGRKMGHLTALAPTPDEALELVLDARRRLTSRA